MIKKTILFLDNTYPEPYQLATLSEKPIGGTEASIIRTALILSKSYQVYVAQKFREQTHRESSSLHFISKSNIDKLTPDYIIVLRKYKIVKQISLQFPEAKIFLWIHTYKNYEYVFKRLGFSKSNIQIVCNSISHKKHTDNLLNLTILARIFSVFVKKTKVNYCYNPINKPTLFEIKKDINKLLFFSSPNKGLDEVIEKFARVRKSLPELCLYIANPGYKNGTHHKHENIIYLGSLSHEDMMQHVNESLCVFYPQESFAETFGLIYAEANAHGTAIIADDIGSAREIMDENNPPIDVRNLDLIIDTIKKWQVNYPKVSYNEKFSQKSILKQWQNILK